MTKRDSAPVGAPCWIDLFTSDQDKSLAFYSELFGWTVDDPGPDSYRIVEHSHFLAGLLDQRPLFLADLVTVVPGGRATKADEVIVIQLPTEHGLSFGYF